MDEYEDLWESLEGIKVSFLADEVVPFLFDKYGVRAVPEFIENHLNGYITAWHEISMDAEDFLRYVGKKNPFFELDLWKLGTENLAMAYLSEVEHDERFEHRESLSLRGERSLLRFRLTSQQDLYDNPFMSHKDFIRKYIGGPLKEDKKNEGFKLKEYEKFKEQEAQVFRIGVVRYYHEIFESLTPEEGGDLQEYLQGFVEHFSEPRKKTTFFLNQHMSRSLEETIWFEQKMLIETPAIEDFCDCARKVGLHYVKSLSNRQRAYPAKHQNKPDDNELASYFEHFMGVVRLSLGYIQSLEKNSTFTQSTFLKALKERPDYLLETIYTALLHDVIEDKEFTTEEVEKMLEKANLKSGLVAQILENLNLLNSKRNGTNGERISTEEYVAEIMKNPVTNVVKFSDIIHNNKDVYENSKFEETGEIKEKWWNKRVAYAPLIEAFMSLPIHMRVQEPAAILNSNRELMQIAGWKSLIRPSQKDEIMSHLDVPVRERVGGFA